jgi:DnaJ-domain-containing protein 1
MQLPGRLKATTLGDLLGALHRSGGSGTLELSESNGRIHRIHLARGCVTAVELDRASASLAEVLRQRDEIDEETLRRSLLRAMASRRLHGEVLVRDFQLAPAIVDRALRRQVLARLLVIEELADAQITFRVTMKPPRGALLDEPLAAAEFLPGKRRARDRDANAQSGTFRTTSYTSSAAMPGGWDPARATAYRALGVPLGAEEAEVKRAYRRLVRTYHPDLHPDATHDERRSLAHRFAEVTAAYRVLVA